MDKRSYEICEIVMDTWYFSGKEIPYWDCLGCTLFENLINKEVFWLYLYIRIL